MQTNVPLLEKKAIKLALAEEWNEAIQVNTEILQADPQNIKAKIRLGNAYLQTKQFKDAERLFKEVIDADPINTIAKKNYELAKSKKSKNSPTSKANGKSLVIEPGTTQEVELEITEKRIMAENFSYGQEFKIKVKKTSCDLLSEDKKVTTIKNERIVRRLNQAKSKKMDLSALFVKGEKKRMKVLLKCSEPIFEGNKQDIKPYMKKGAIDEPAIEMETFDDE